MSLTFIDLFAGIGGMRIAFESAGFKALFANEIDDKAVHTYKHNFGEINHSNIFDLLKKEPSLIPKKFNVLAGGFPCQPFSIAGHKKGFADKGRGDLLFAIVKILKMRQPDAFLLENVKHLKSHDDEKTFAVVMKQLRSAGYHVTFKVLDSMLYGNVPQTRARIYIVGFRDQKKLSKFKFPEKLPRSKTIFSILDKEVPQRFYYNATYKEIFPRLEESVKFKDRFYQYRRVYVRENKNGVCPTLTASMGLGGHNVPIVRDSQGIRKITPKECARLQGFPDSFQIPSDLKEIYLYRQLGNTVTVSVISRLAEHIRRALEGK